MVVGTGGPMAQTQQLVAELLLGLQAEGLPGLAVPSPEQENPPRAGEAALGEQEGSSSSSAVPQLGAA